MTLAKNSPIEELYANNFLSLHNFTYEVKQFNIITGDIASGKSLIIKALNFFNGIFISLLTKPYDIFLESLNIDFTRKNLINKFSEIFYLDGIVFDIAYRYNFGDMDFSIKLFRDKKEDNISLESVFLEDELKKWKEYINQRGFKLKEPPSPDQFREAKYELYNKLSRKSNGTYPLATTFVPSTRAALAIVKSDSKDYYLSEYSELIALIKNFRKSAYREKIHEIVKAAIKINGDIHLLHEDGREVDISYASSGQQEVFYILLLLDKLPTISYKYAKQHYIYIEEPETHLFPPEQKLTSELIVELFNALNDDPALCATKFFITTHSPYVLNTVNNMLLKGSIKKKFSDSKNLQGCLKSGLSDKKVKKIPDLAHEKISVVFVSGNGKIDNILAEYKGNYLIDPEEINKISIDIMDEYNFLDSLSSKLANESYRKAAEERRQKLPRKRMNAKRILFAAKNSEKTAGKRLNAEKG